MKKPMCAWRRVSSLLMATCLLVVLLAALPTAVSAALTGKVRRSYEIAVVFDNSGSMYQSQGWCRAKYAMEIFASMLNYESGDRLRIFPMWEVTTDGTQPSKGGSYAAIQINNKNDIDKISNLYTVHPSNTPFEPVLEAQEYLKSSTATDKWIIVLTDGAFNEIERGRTVGKISAKELTNRLKEATVGGINVQYLGFGGATKLQSEEQTGFYAQTSSDTSLKDDLIGICNRIFQRSILPETRLSGNTLNIDLSMKNLIVFVQGPNAKITSLTDANGKTIPITMDSGQRKYSEIRAHGYPNAKVDDTLAGQVVTFGACPKGSYTLNYTGADVPPQIFYEPDVDICVTLTNSDGEVVDGSSGEITADEYTVTSMIVDGKTGEDVTSHPLMGNDVTLTTKVTTTTSSGTKEYPNGAKIELIPDSSTQIVVEGRYLKDYTISSKDDPGLLWLSRLTVHEPDIDFNATVEQPQTWYKLSKHKTWQPIKVALTIADVPLTAEQMSQTKVTVTSSDSVAYRCEQVPGESAYYVYIGSDANGNFVKPNKGNYRMEIRSTFTDEFGKEIGETDKADFKIRRLSVLEVWLLILLVFLVIAFIVFLIMRQKVLPKGGRCEFAELSVIGAVEPIQNAADVRLSRKGKTITITCKSHIESEDRCNATFTLRPVSPRYVRSQNRHVKIVGISSNCASITINGTEYIKKNGKWVNALKAEMLAEGAALPPIEQEVRNPLCELRRNEAGGAQLSTKLRYTKSK